MVSFAASFACIAIVQQLAAQTDKYIRVDQLKTYANAQSYCRSQYGTDLASLHSAGDNNAAKDLCVAGGQSCWIGLNDIAQEGAFVWEDRTALDYGSDVSGGVYPWDNVNGNEPNNALGNEHCVKLARGGAQEKWNDDACSDQFHFLCNAYTRSPTPSPTQQPTANPSQTPTDVPSKQPTQDPTKSPTEAPTGTPTTPAPTEPADLNCGDSVSGDYGGVAMSISVTMPHDGEMTIDARGSSLAIAPSGLRRSTSPSVVDNGLGDEDPQSGIISMSNLIAGTYQYLLDLGTETGTFSIATQCASNAPSKSPTASPTSVPTENASGEVDDHEDDNDQGEDGRLVAGPAEEEIETLFGFGFSNMEWLVLGATLLIVCVCCVISLCILRRIREFKKQQVDSYACFTELSEIPPQPKTDDVGEMIQNVGERQ